MSLQVSNKKKSRPAYRQAGFFQFSRTQCRGKHDELHLHTPQVTEPVKARLRTSSSLYSGLAPALPATKEPVAEAN